MKTVLCRLFLLLLSAAFLSTDAMALQTSASREDESRHRLAPAQRKPVPMLVRFSGSLGQGKAQPGEVRGLFFNIYERQDSPAPIWSESQNVTVDAEGRYTVLLGASSTEGIPESLFANGEARWVGIVDQGSNEEVRIMLVSVPYALKAADAATLGGRPASDFVLSSASATTSTGDSAPGSVDTAAINNGATNGTANFLAKFDGASTIVNSAFVEVGGRFGLGTATPNFQIDIQNADATATGANLFRIQSPSVNGATMHFISTSANGRHWGFGSNFILGNGEFGIYDYTAAASRFFINSAGQIGLGTTNPAYLLDVQSSTTGATGANLMRLQTPSTNGALIRFISTSANGRDFGFGSNFILGTGEFGIFDYTAGVSRLLISGTGNVGIGTSTPSAKLEAIQTAVGAGAPSVAVPPPSAVRGDATSTSGVTAGVLGISSGALGRGVLGESLSSTGQNAGVFGLAASSPDGTGVWGEAVSTTGDTAGVFGRSFSNTGTGVLGEAVATSGDAVGVAGISRAAGGTGVLGEVTANTGENYGISGRVFNSTNAGSAAGMFINNGTGSLILGRTSTAPGTVNVFRVSTTGAVFGNGVFNTSGADFAESVAVKEDRSNYQPGDVLAIDTTGTRRFGKVATPYSTLVAGIYSTRPGVLASPHPMEDPRIANEEVPLAVVGIVPCKVTNENGAIKAGDLLVSSSREGYAMKGTDQKRMNGAVIGKALQDMKGATGVVEVLVSLQ
ncbi:MAG: hypothetical protein ABIP81_00730 [Terriglobales bacterium]